MWLLKFLRNISEASDKHGTEAVGSLRKILESADLTEEELLKRSEISYNTLMKSLKSIERNSKKLRISYYFGGPNVFLNGCLLSYAKNDDKGFQENYEGLLKYKKIIEQDHKSFYMEILYGVAGYLYCFLVLQTQCTNYNSDPDFSSSLAKNVYDLVALIIHVGTNAYDKNVDLSNPPKDFRLVFHFHEKEYFGAAHGLFGVLYMLMKAYQINHAYFAKASSLLNKHIQASVEASLKYLLGFQHSTGSFASSAKSKSKGQLVQFCHGSTGAIPCLLLATEVFKGSNLAEKCFNAAVLAGENVWEEGILKKGYGLCHGISGNAYSLLSLYKYTKDIKWLYRTYCFIITKDEKEYQDVIRSYEFENSRFAVGVSDYPYSIMLGLAGDLCLETDCLFPESGK